jgi:hypothetical protein
MSQTEFDLVQQAGGAARSARVPYLGNRHLKLPDVGFN